MRVHHLQVSDTRGQTHHVLTEGALPLLSLISDYHFGCSSLLERVLSISQPQKKRHTDMCSSDTGNGHRSRVHRGFFQHTTLRSVLDTWQCFECCLSFPTIAISCCRFLAESRSFQCTVHKRLSTGYGSSASCILMPKVSLKHRVHLRASHHLPPLPGTSHHCVPDHCATLPRPAMVCTDLFSLYCKAFRVQSK